MIDASYTQKIYCKGLNILIAITKSESERVREVFPSCRDCKNLYSEKVSDIIIICQEAEKYLRLIVDSNYAAASICQQIDKERERNKRRHRH